MSITSYSELQTAVENWLDRSDLSSRIPEFISLAEAKFKRDKRLRKLQDRGAFSLSNDEHDLPSDFQSLESWYHDGPSYYGPIEIVGAEQLGMMRAKFGDTGVPAYAALIGDVVRVAPVPDGTYSTKMTYWRKIVSLSDSKTSNWLLDDHPDIYLYGTLLESAPFLRDDERTVLWKGLLEDAIEQLDDDTWNSQWSGTMRRQFRPIGG